MRRLSILGVAVGGMVDIVTTNIAALPVIMYASAQIGLLTIPKAEQTAVLMSYLKDNFALYAALTVLGCLCSVLGGYVAALIARRAELLTGASSAFLCVGLGIWTMVQGNEQVPTWLHILLLPLSPVLGAIGGYLRVRQVRRRATAPTPVAASGAA
jgi:hypothetical protein